MIINKNCPKCNTPFYTNKKYCSQQCANSVSRNIKKDIIGQFFNRLTVLEYIGSKQRSNKYNKLLRVYKCLCACGTICEKFGVDLRAGNSQSCGCFRQEIQIKIHVGKISPQRNPKGAQQQTAKGVWKDLYHDGISFDDFFKISQLPCNYCGVSPSNHTNKISKKSCNKEWYDQGWWDYNGLDRIDSLKDHAIENVVPSCWRCNKAKGTMTLDEFKEWIKIVHNHLL